MSLFRKKFRYYYWLGKSFVQKNIKFLIVSFIASFLFIFLAIHFFPVLSSVITSKNERVGIIGQYTLQNLPPDITNLISNSLITINSKGEVIPVLANSWELLDKGKTYRFHLKQNLLWNDNKTFIAADINYDFKGIQARIIDDKTIEFNLTKPLSIFPVYLTKPLLRYPLIGIAGLYQIDSYRTEKGNVVYLSLTPNKTELPHKTFFFYETEDKMIAAYKTGQINVFKTSKKSIADIFNGWKNTNIFRSTNYNQILTLFFNNATPIFSKDMKDVRKALAYATPKFNDLGEEATGPIPPTSWAFVPDLKKYSYNPDRAQTMISKNVPASESATLNLYTFYDYLNVAEEIKKSFETAGLKINVNVLSYLPQTFDMLLTIWNPPQDPDQYYFWHSTQAEGNITNYKNVKVDKLLEEGRDVIDINERKKIYSDFQKAILDDVPAHFIFYPYVYTVERK